MGAFCLVEIFFIAFFPVNRTEVDDGYWYAAGIRDEPYLKLYNPRFFLFLPILKVVFSFIRSLNLTIDAYHFICAVSMIFSGLTLVLLYDTLRKYLRFQRNTALFVVALLAISYEYWRYSVEAEVYVLSMFFILVTLRLFLKYKEVQSWKYLMLLCLTGAFTTLLYKPNFIPIYIVFPVFLLYYKKIWHLIIYYAVSAALIIGSFYIVFQQLSTDTSFIGYLFGGTNHPVGNPSVSIFVIGSNLLSVLWIFSFKDAVAFIVDHFPHKVIEEEIFLAGQIGHSKYLLLGSALVIGALFVAFVINAIKMRGTFARYRFRILLVILLWIFVYGGFLMVMDPTSNEPWLMIQIPIVIMTGAVLIEPLKKKQWWMSYAFLVLVFLNNTLGGMNLLKNRRYDYYYQKSQWLISHTSAKDHIISYGPISFTRYLRYYLDAEVLDLEEDHQMAMALLEHPEKVRGQIYLSENIFHPPRAILYRSQNDVTTLFELYEEKGYRSMLVAGENGDKFSTYKLLVNKFDQ